MISEAVGPPSNKQERMLPNLPQSQLAAALHQLDKRIERALQMLPSIYGSASIHDPFRGLHINPDDVATLLSHAPGAPLFNQGDEIFDHTGSENLNEDSSRLGWLARAFNLSTFDLDVVLIVLAPEIDLRYERLYAYLQDDVTRRRPSVDLALNLLCTTFEDKLAHRAHFTGQAPLLKQGILHLVHDQSHSEASLLAQYLKLDGLIVQFLLGDPGLDHRLHDFCELFQPSTSLQKLPYPEDFKRAILALLAQSLESGYPLHLFFQGPAGSGRRRLAEALAWETKRPLLLADLRRTSETALPPGLVPGCHPLP